MEILETVDRDAIAGLRDEWNGLLDRCPAATIYQTWEWNEAWWRVFGANKRLRLLQVREGGRLMGFAPLYVSRHLGTPLRRLAFIGTGATDYLDVLAEEDRAPEVCAAILRYLDTMQGLDAADLQQLRPESELRRAAECHPSLIAGARRGELIPQEPCPYLELPAEWDEYSARLGKKNRSNISYAERLIARTFSSAEASLARSDNLETSLDALFDLHQLRWKARFLPGVLRTEKVREFHRIVAERFLERGWLRLHVTRIDCKIVAALYCFRFRERYYYYLGGFAPDLAKYSLGTVQTAGAIRQAIREGCSEFDFLRGNEPYKYRWQPEERVNCRLILSQPQSVRSRSLLAINRIERKVEHKAKAFAESRGRRKSS